MKTAIDFSTAAVLVIGDVMLDTYIEGTVTRICKEGPVPVIDWTDERADDWRKPYPGWVRTRYEAKAIKAGRVPSYLTARRRAS